MSASVLPFRSDRQASEAAGAQARAAQSVAAPPLRDDTAAAHDRANRILDHLEALYALEKRFRALLDRGRFTDAIFAAGEMITLAAASRFDDVLARVTLDAAESLHAEWKRATDDDMRRRSAADLSSGGNDFARPTFDNPDDCA